MQLKHKFIFLIFILFGITILFFIHADKVVRESETTRLQNEMMLFAQTLVSHYLSGDFDAVYKMGSNFGYTHVDSVPKDAVTVYESFSDMLYFKIFSYDSFMGFSIVFLEDVINLVKIVDGNAWSDYKFFILLFQLSIIALLVFFLFHYILRPINRLTYAIDELKSGVYAKMLKVNRKDEIGQLMNAFNEMNEKISCLIKSRELITRNIAHELKTPLAKVKLALSLKEGEELKQDLNRYISSLDRISHNMLEYERIQEGDLSLNFSEFLSESILFEALCDLDYKNISLNIIETIKIKGDLRLLGVAVRNLVENAIKYSSDGMVNIELSENGIMFSNRGIALKNDISYYFEPFYRGDVSESGYGLGLSIVNEIVKLHKMSIEYEYDFGLHIFYLRFKPNL